MTYKAIERNYAAQINPTLHDITVHEIDGIYEIKAMQYMHSWDENGAGMWHAQGKLGYSRLAGPSSPLTVHGNHLW